MINLSACNLQYLYCFHVVASEGSIKAAANKLRVTQPAVSMRLKNLESDLNAPLFDREFRSLRLTSSGQSLLEYTEQIFALTFEALSSLVTIEKPKATLRAGIVPSVSNAIVHDVLRPFWHKDQILQVTYGTYTDLHEQLERNRLDLMIVDTEPKHKYGWRVKEIDQRRLIFAGAQKFKSLKNAFPKSLNSIPMISFSDNNSLCFQLERFLALHKVTPNIIGKIDDFSLLLSFLIDGIGVGVVSVRAAQQFLDSKLLINLGEMKDIISRLWVIERTVRR